MVKKLVFKCNDCGKISTGQEWDDAAKEIFDNGFACITVSMDPDSKSIHVCPKCHKQVYGNEITATEALDPQVPLELDQVLTFMYSERSQQNYERMGKPKYEYNSTIIRIFEPGVVIPEDVRKAVYTERFYQDSRLCQEDREEVDQYRYLFIRQDNGRGFIFSQEDVEKKLQEYLSVGRVKKIAEVKKELQRARYALTSQVETIKLSEERAEKLRKTITECEDKLRDLGGSWS